VPLTAPLNTIVVIGLAEHTICEEGVATALGVGLTVILPVAVTAPVQPPPVGVTV
jgi:Na+-transporting NADH:ubiquinone oxidoreductase subunit NqrE